jgi:hypothetical protein
LPVFPQCVAALGLIKRRRVLQELALTRRGERQHSDTCARLFHKHRRKARAQCDRSLCLALFTRDSPHCLAHNVLQGGNGPMTLSPRTAHLGNTDALMDLTASDQLCTDPAVFKIWVDAHASGLIYGATKQRPNRETRKLSVGELRRPRAARGQPASEVPGLPPWKCPCLELPGSTSTKVSPNPQIYAH